MSDAELTVQLAAGADKVARLRRLWERAPWTREEAEYPYFSARSAGGDVSPFGAFVLRGDEIAAGAAGRFESKRMPAAIGYARLYAPRLRVLQLVSGGVTADGDESAAVLARAVAGAMAGGAADALALPALPLESAAYGAFAALGGPLERQRFVPSWTRRRLVLPASFDDFLASRSGKIRFNVRYYGKRLEQLENVSVTILRGPEDFDRLVHDLDAISQLTYQRALGAGFANTEEQRRLARVGLEHGWVRAYVLAHDDSPVAYWLCSVHGGTMLLRATGFDPAYAQYSPGTYLLMRVIEDACSDPELRVLDFGPGRSDYKRHFSSEAYEERNLTLFAPTFRGRRVNLVRTAVLGAGLLGRSALDAAGLTGRMRSAWRRRLRATAP